MTLQKRPDTPFSAQHYTTMPQFGGAAAGHEVEAKKRSGEDIATGITNALLILIVIFFTCGSLWLGIFAIPSFFAFFRASVVAISSVREVRPASLYILSYLPRFGGHVVRAGYAQRRFRRNGRFVVLSVPLIEIAGGGVLNQPSLFPSFLSCMRTTTAAKQRPSFLVLLFSGLSTKVFVRFGRVRWLSLCLLR